jgi:hypothetical protein
MGVSVQVSAQPLAAGATSLIEIRYSSFAAFIKKRISNHEYPPAMHIVLR